ncbi:MAG: pectin acetylesterase-family hydrolase [Lamprobacter sp.]|uniref:pectin acetylesterase-family hydrolase n=1 Tax=Lamprobacter sp. TaxID=3100796 RepID=UPI002B25BCF3|nr:pectin acetylesterase-family hydrolase [Lamprobacter sp.]MEA3641355.1 pectin acetylesterase-family hydrolase [Lamprobacter sp.]
MNFIPPIQIYPWLLALGALCASAPISADWQRIDVPAGFRFYDGQGVERSPACSQAPSFEDYSGGNDQVVQQVGGATSQANGNFSFFADMAGAVSGNLLIYFAGGGACWDPATCIGSPLSSNPVYLPVVTETTAVLEAYSADQDGSGAGGLLVNTRPSNPYAGFAKVYIPYCTGDVHVGSNDQPYEYEGLDWTIRHRGFDNLLMVLQWLEQQDLMLERIVLAGSSAGGYGALINFPVIHDALGDDASYSLVIDSANGVLTDGFVAKAFGEPDPDAEDGWREGVWNAYQNIDSIIQPALHVDANQVLVQGIKRLGQAYPDARISQSTAAFDVIQTSLYLTMQQVDQGRFDPYVPFNEDEIFTTALFDWSPRARSAMIETAFGLSNFRYYLGAGTGHIHLLDPPPELAPFPTTNYFEENSAKGIDYTAWLDDMLNNPRRFFGTNWRNLSCFPFCFLH